MSPVDEPVPPAERGNTSVLDVVERALEQDPAGRADWLTRHCPIELLDAARRVLRTAEAMDADEDVTLESLMRPKT